MTSSIAPYRLLESTISVQDLFLEATQLREEKGREGIHEILQKIEKIAEKRWTLTEGEVESLVSSLAVLKEYAREVKNKKNRISQILHCCLPFGNKALRILSTLESDLLEVRNLYDYIEEHQLFWLDECQRKNKNLYIPPHESGVARAIQASFNGKIFIHLNRKKKGDQILGKGKNKIVKLAVDWETKELYASTATYSPKEIEMLKVFRGREGFLQLIDEVSYRKPNGAIKYRFLSPCYRGTLYRCVAQSLSREKKKRVFEKLIQAVATMHRMGYLHRDLHCFNILLTEEGDPILADFESVCPIEEERERQMISPFSSPDPLEEVVGDAADSWALANNLFFLLHEKMAPWVSRALQTRSPSKQMEIIAHAQPQKLPQPKNRNSPEHLVWRMFALRLSAIQAEQLLETLVW